MVVSSSTTEFVGELPKDADPLLLAATGEAALCTLIGLDGPFARALGAQFAVSDTGARAGDMTGGCLDNVLARECEDARADGKGRLLRYGQGSPFIDIRLPCGGGLDIAVDPAPDPGICAAALTMLRDRQPVGLALPLSDTQRGIVLRSPQAGERSHLDADERVFHRVYCPSLCVYVFGDGPEASSLARLTRLYGARVEQLLPSGQGRSGGLFLGRAPEKVKVDHYTAIALLFHDHDWELPIIDWALRTSAFYIGALGGRRTAHVRDKLLRSMGWDEAAAARVEGPIGIFGPTRDADALALSVLAELVSRYHQIACP